jgi:adenylate cyclase
LSLKFTSSSPIRRRADVTEPVRGGTRIAVTAGILTVPLVGLLLVLRQPSLDLRWEHHPAHFWLVLITAMLSAVLAYATGDAAGRRGDARLLYVSLAFLSSAGFLGLHALATPGVLLEKSNTGFLIATPVGVGIGSVFAALSTADFSGDSAVRHVRIGKLLRWVLLGFMVLWAVWSLASLPPLDRPPQFAERFPLLLAVPAVLLYAGSAVRYIQLWRRHPSLMLVAVPSAFILLAEAMVAIAFARNWHLSWWEWHVLLLLAFGLVALSAQNAWREERFAELYLPQTSAGNRDISVLFADLEGFTSFSETHEPDEVGRMLNEYFGAAVPAVVTPYGGDVDRIIGDALMVTFNKRGDQPDHAERAAGAGLALQKATLDLGKHHPDWPRFRVGINSGHVSVSLLGAEGGRTHTIVGDTVNIASRIEGTAPTGGVAIGPDTKALLPDAVTTPLGQLQLKGRQEPLDVYLLTSL